MRTIAAVVVILVVGLAGCKRPVPAEQVGEACSRRLQERSGLSASRAEAFCDCFVAAAAKKMSTEELASQMQDGGSQAFKDALRPEFEQCKAQAR